MRIVAEKLRAVETSLSEQKGEFYLFGLFLRDDAPGVCDLVVAADWIQADKAAALRAISQQIQQALTPEELTKLARIVVIERTDAALQAINSAFAIAHGLAEVKNSNFFGQAIKEAFVITSQRPKAA